MGTYVDALLQKEKSSNENIDIVHIDSISGINSILRKKGKFPPSSPEHKQNSTLYGTEEDIEFEYFMMALLKSLENKFSHFDFFTKSNERQFIQLMRNSVQLYPKDHQFSEYEVNEDEEIFRE